MRIIPRYVVIDTLRIALMAFLVFTAIFFVGLSVSATRGGITLSQFLRIMPFIVLYTMRFTLPISLLVGAAFVLGRLVADREILALQACGVHFASIVIPLLAVGLLFSAGMFYFNDRILPECDRRRRNALKSFAQEILTLQKGRNKSFHLPGYSVFCREYDGRTLRGLMIFRDDPKLPFEIIAREGQVWLGAEGRHIIIDLSDVRITYYGNAPAEKPKGAGGEAQGGTVKPGSVDRVSYGELVSENYAIYVPIRQRTTERASFLTTAELVESSYELARGLEQAKAALAAATSQEERQAISEDLGRGAYLGRKIEIEYHRRYASALAPFLFLLVGIPLPILFNSRVRLLPPFVALMVVMLTYFAVGIGAESFAETGKLAPWFAMWLPDILTLCVGGFLLWKLFEK